MLIAFDENSLLCSPHGGMCVVPDRRTLIVLASLVGAMTVASGLLLLLEPKNATALRGISLSSIDHVDRQAHDILLASSNDRQAGPWSAIVVHHTRASGAGGYSDAGIANYHFAIHEQGSSSDRFEVGYRWRQQSPGAYWAGPEKDWVNRHAIGVCLVSDGEEGPSEDQLEQLIGLVQQLQAEFQIPADRVVLQPGIGHISSKGRWFPTAWFRQQLLIFAAP